MQNISLEFESSLDELVALALSMAAIEMLGYKGIQKQIADYPESSLHIGVGDPNDPGVVENSSRMMFVNILASYTNRTVNVEELIHSQMIQLWLEFLDQIFYEILQLQASGNATIKANELKIDIKKLDLSQLGTNSFNNTLLDKALRDFQFLQYGSKIQTIKKMVGANGIDEEKLVSAKKHVLCRNLLQHHKGVLRQEDINGPGYGLGRNFSMIGIDKKPQVIGVGQRINITYWEIEQIRDDFVVLAKEIVSCATQPPHDS